MLIFINGKNEKLKKKFVSDIKKQDKNENTRSINILNLSNFFDKILKILRVGNNDNIYIIKNSIENDLYKINETYNKNMVSSEDYNLFNKHYIYFKNKVNIINKNNIFEYNVTETNYNIIFNKIKKSINPKPIYEEVKCLTVS